MSATRFPLAWPQGWKRTRPDFRRRATFGTKRPGEYKRQMTVGAAIDRLRTELSRLGVLDGDWIVSTNIKVRLDGLPYSDQREPDDVGAAVYFRLFEEDRVLACDAWTRVADNLTAIAAHIETIRAQDRYGVGTLNQAFAGYAALPAKGQTWRTTLGFALGQTITREDVELAFRARAKDAHPDKDGGSHDAMASLTAARTEALAELA